MIERDVGDDREQRLDDVGGVEASAQAYFQDGDLYLALREVEEGERGEGFEEAGMMWEAAGCDQGAGGLVDLEVEAGEGFLGDLREGVDS